MSTVYLFAGRDPLVRALHDGMCHHDLGGYRECERKADALLASGVVSDAASLTSMVRNRIAEDILAARDRDEAWSAAEAWDDAVRIARGGVA